MSQPEKKDTQEFAQNAAVINKESKGFTDEERAAIIEARWFCLNLPDSY